MESVLRFTGVTWPISLCSLSALYQLTHCRVSHSTWPAGFQGPRKLVTSALNSPMRLSASASILLCLSSSGCPVRWDAQGSVYYADDIPLDTAYDFASRFAFCRSPRGIGLGSFIIAQAYDGHAVDGGVCLPVATTVQSHPVHLAPPCQSDAAHAAWVRLLAVVDAPGGLSKTLPLAARPVRHAAAASGQTGRDHRREENPDHHDAASLMPASEPHPAPVRCACPATTNMTQTSRPAHPETPTRKAPDDTAVRRENPDANYARA